MSPWEYGLKLCAELRSATASFSVSTYEEVARRYRFHLDRLPAGPESTERLEAIGGYPPELLAFLQSLGGRTLNSSCYFGPRVFLDEFFDEDFFKGAYASSLNVTRNDIRIIGGDHGEGRWVLLTRSGCVSFVEIDDDYLGQVPEPCFTNFTNWCRVNLILGVIESELERRSIDVYQSVPSTFSRGLLAELSTIDGRLNEHTWPYRLLYPLHK